MSLDEEYLAAVDSKDMKAVQKMVTAAAKEAGYTTGPAWHGTDRDFTGFEPPSEIGYRHRDDDQVRGNGEVYWFTGSKKMADAYAKSAWSDGPKGAPRVICAFLKMSNPKREDYEGSPADFLTEDIDDAKAAGCDGLIALEVDDGGTHDHFAVFSANQIKLADPAAYDDNGELVPLSKRFLPTTDMRGEVAPPLSGRTACSPPPTKTRRIAK